MDVDRLIFEVRSRGALWNQMHSQYNNRIVVDKMWDEISNVMDVPKKLLRTKWKSLRDNFRQEIKKIPKHCAIDDGTSSAYIPSWAHFPKLTFLTEQMSLRQPYLLNITENLNDFCEDSPDNTLEPIAEEINLKPVVDHDQIALITNGKPQKRKATGTTTSEKRQCTVTIEGVDDSFSYTDDNSSHELSDDYHFFMSLLPYVQSLPRPKAMLLRMKIQEMVYNELYNTQNDSDLENEQILP